MKNAILLSAVVLFIMFSCTKQKTFMQPQKLQTEYQSSPIGLDVPFPRLSWYVNDTSRGAKQTAYHIIVSASLKKLKKNIGDIWDSKQVESGQSVHVKYAGPGLDSRKIYFWKVKTWDQDSVESSWSEPATWEMGLLNREDWQARWIGLDVEPDRSELEKYGNWIWHPEEKGLNIPIYVRKTITLPEGKTVRKAMLSVTADNEFEAWVNNNKKGKGDDWQRFYNRDITNDLTEGENILAFSAITTQPEYCGLIFYLDLVYADGTNEYISSDESCLTSLKKIPGWTKSVFNDESWISAEIIAPYGEGYWGRIDAPGPVPRSTLIRKEFTASKSVKKARAYVTGLGNYELYVNGNKIGKDLLTPGWTDYRDRVQYQVYDITDKIQPGENAAGMFLGNMWWSSGLGWMGGVKYSRGPERGLCQIEIEYKDGSTEIIASDETWKGHKSPITDNSIYQGEKFDARLEIPGWSEIGLNQDEWEPVNQFTEEDTLILSAQAGPPIRIAQEIEPVSVTEVEPGKFVFDMGTNLVGFARLKVQGEAGTEVTLRFAELLHEDGTVAQENLRSAKATDKYILKGGEMETWHPRFTYHGFRYVQVEGFPGTPGKENLTGLQFYSSAPVTGKFKCSNEIINKVWKNIVNGQKGNMQSVPTDCPQRDERLGWTGDAQMFSPTACYNMSMARFFTKWMIDITDSQDDTEGWVPDVNPGIVVDGPGKPAWGDAITVIPWMVYKFYGDEGILEKNYEGMKAWVEFMRLNARENLYIFDRNGWHGYGDWISVVPSPGAPISAEYYFYSTKLLSKAAKILGKEEDAKEYKELAGKIAEAINKKFFDPKTNNYLEGTQTANLLPLAFGIVPDELKQEVANNIAANVIAKEKHPSTGFLGTGYLLPMLSDYGYHELAYEVASQTTYPSWGYMAENGATSMWELWNSDKERPDQMNSRNHFALGSCGEWYYAYLAGIKPDPEEPGFKHSIISPKPAGDLTYALGEIETGYGLLKCHWQKTDDGLRMIVIIPPNTSATVKIPVAGYNNPSILEGGNTIFSAGGAATPLQEGLEFIEAGVIEVAFKAAAGSYVFTLYDNPM